MGCIRCHQECNGTNWSEFDTTEESGLTGGHYNQGLLGLLNAALQFVVRHHITSVRQAMIDHLGVFVSIMVQIGVNVLI